MVQNTDFSKIDILCTVGKKISSSLKVFFHPMFAKVLESNKFPHKCHHSDVMDEYYEEDNTNFHEY